MTKAKAPVQVTSEVSGDYFRLRGRLMTIESHMDQTTVTEELTEFRSAAYAAQSEGAITTEQYEELMQRADKVPSAVSASGEFLRLKSRHASLTANGRVMNGAEREDFNEEVDLALRSSAITPQEAEMLRALPATLPVEEGPKVIDIPMRRSAADAPNRKRAAAKRNEHTPRYHELVQDYRALYVSDPTANKENQVRLFFRSVEAAYRAEDITLAEYREFHKAMNDTEAFLSDVEIPTSSRDFKFLRERIVASVSSDEALKEIAKQIGVWAKDHGTPENLIKSNPLGVALENLDAFLASGQQLVAIGDVATDRRQLMQMRL